MYQIRYVVINDQHWVVDSNRKLFIAHQIEKLFGLIFSCTDVTNTYVANNETLDDIDDMIQDLVYLISVKKDFTNKLKDLTLNLCSENK